MQNLLKLLSSKVFYKWMISYVIILSIPTIIIGYFFYSRTSLLIDEKNIEDYRRRVENFSLMADGKLKDIKSIGVMLTETSWIKKVMDYKTRRNDEFDTLLLMDIKKELLNYRTLNPVIEYISVIFPYSDCVLTNDGIDDIDFFIHYTNAFPEKEAGDILTAIEQYNYFTVLKHSQVGIFAKNCEVVPILQSLNYSEAAPRATMLVLVNTGALMDMAKKEIQSENGIECMIVYPDGTMIKSGSGDAAKKELPEECFSAAVKSGVYRNGTDYVFVASSQYAPWKYVFSIPDTLMVSNPGNTVLLVLAAAAVAFLAGFLVATLFSVLNLQPLRKLAEHARLISGESAKSSRMNEYKVIRQSIQRIEEQKQVKDKQILKYWPAIMETEFEECMLDKNWEDASELKTIFAHLGVEVEEESRYSVVMFEPANGLDRGEEAGAKGESAQVLPFVEHAVREHGIKAITLKSRKRTVMILYPGAMDAAREANINQLTALIKRQFCGNPEVWIGVGPFLKGMDGIAGSYRNAKIQLDSMIFTGGKEQGGNPGEHTADGKGFYFYPIELEAQLVNHLKNGDADSAGEILKKLKEENYNQRKLSSESLRRLLVEIIETVMKVADSLNYEDASWKEEYKNILKSKTDVEMWNFIHEAVGKVCRHVAYFHENLRYKLNEHIIEYVNSEYTSKFISLKEMSARFQIPAPTLSKMFKELSGVNFLDYINRKRIDRAKALLIETAMEIYAVSETVGYESVTTFRRMFKKYAGVNPTEYRTNINGIESFVFAGDEIK